MTVQGRPGLVVERIEGPNLLAVVARWPWRFASVGLLCGSLHARMHALDGPVELPLLVDELRARLQTDLVPADIGEAAMAELGRLPRGRSPVWEWVWAAARLAEGIEEERDARLATARSGAEN